MAGPRQPTTAILLQTHVFDRAASRLHAALQRACGEDHALFVLMHAPPGATRPAALGARATHFVTTPEIRAADFPAKSAGQDWSIWKGGHTDLIALHFARQHPEFEHYWVIEYDVRFTGDWQRLFRHFAGNPADLLTTTIRSYEAHPDWEWWSSLTDPAGRSVAGPGMLCAFMPIFRFSRAGLQEMARRYQAGWGGHTELTWPTFLNQAGLVVEDLGGTGPYVGKGNLGLFYDNQPRSWSLGPGSLVWRPARVSAGLRRNRLYHPVKPASQALRDQFEYRSRQMRGRLGTAYRALRSLSGRHAV